MAEDDLAEGGAPRDETTEAAPAINDFEALDAETADDTAPETAEDAEADMMARLVAPTNEVESEEQGEDRGEDQGEKDSTAGQDTPDEVEAEKAGEATPRSPEEGIADAPVGAKSADTQDEADDDLAALLDSVSHQDAAQTSQDMPAPANAAAAEAEAEADGTADREHTEEADDDGPHGPHGAQDPSEDTLAQLLADALGDGASAPQPDLTLPEAEVEADMSDTLDASAEAEAEAEAEAKQPLRARVVKMKRADLDAALAGGDLVEDGASASSLSPEAEADLQRELAEVEAELRQTRDAAPDDMPQVAAATHEDQADAPYEEATPGAAEDAAATLESDRNEADDTEIADDSGDHDDARDDAPHDNAAAITPKRAGRLGQIGTDTQAPRIFEEADSQLEEPVGNERRNAIQHLRAAVAATKAERSAGGAMSSDVDDQPYRLDLENAVRPRRPRPVAGSGTPRPERPSSERSAPLKLVAEQRVDAPAQPVRPRRVSRADLTAAAPRTAPAEAESPATPPRDSAAPEADTAPRPASGTRATGSFTEFAGQMGAKGLTDLLEAAAAYLSDVEGMPQFSRPMLMQKLNEVDDTDFSREEGLRSFGQLLRQGKLQKLKGGRFAVTDETEFRRSA